MKLMIFAITLHIVFSEVGCLVKMRYTNNECTQVTEEYEVRALSETCLQESGDDSFFKGTCTIGTDEVVDTDSILSWEECSDDTCDDGQFGLCRGQGRLRSPEQFECRFSKLTTGVGGNDVWEQYICMKCNEMPCYGKLVDGTNLNPECTVQTTKAPTSSPTESPVDPTESPVDENDNESENTSTSQTSQTTKSPTSSPTQSPDDATESPVTETDNGNENGDESTDAPEPTTSTSETETPLDGDQSIPENILDDPDNNAAGAGDSGASQLTISFLVLVAVAFI